MKGRKIWKKCAAGILAAAMMMGMTLGVSAAENKEAAPYFDAKKRGSVTIIKQDSTNDHNPIAGVTFNYAKIGDFVQDEEEGNAVLGFSLNEKITDYMEIEARPLGYTKEGTPYYDGGELQKEFTNRHDPETLAGIATEKFGTTDEKGIVKQENMELGLYLFVETNAPSGVVEAHDPFILSVPMTSAEGNTWEYDITVYPKNDLITEEKVPKPEKSVEGTKPDQGKDTASVGDLLTYTLKTDIIDAFGSLDRLVLHDQMSKGLTLQRKLNGEYIDAELDMVKLDKSGIFTVEGISRVTGETEEIRVDKEIEVEAEERDGGTYLSIEFVNANEIKEQYSSVSVSYRARVNKFAEIYDPNTNTVTLDYGTHSEIPGNEVSVYTYGYALQKVDGKDNALAGAEFQIFATEEDAKNRQNPLTFLSEQENGKLIDTATSGEDGIVKFYGLKPGTYWIMETKAPNGYNLLKDPVQITVTSGTGKLPEGQADIQIVNTKGFELPETGGAGTIAFTLGGIIVMILAVVIYLKSRKKQS